MTNDEIGREAEVAIIGMAGRFPGAKTLEQFWRNLRDGINSISYFSVSDLEKAGVPRATLNDPQYIRASPILQDADKFDASLFGYSPREASFIDPQQRVLLECAWEALEHAGYSAAEYPFPIGVYAGSSLNTYFLYSGLHRRLEKEFVLALSSSDKDFVATRIAHKLNLQGPAITVQTACSTSLAAVHVACQSLFTGECDMALAGGVSVKIPQRAGYFWQQGAVVSEDGHIRTFDAKATGTVFGSGAGIVVLKRLSDAIRDGDFIHAVIKGTAINNDGSAKATFTSPSVNKQSDVVVEALARAGVSAETVSYIEAHGTGTPLGDPIEITALTKAFRLTTQRSQFCAIGSVKPNIGHAEAASGILALIKTVLALQHEAIPPAVDFEQPNPNINFAATPFFVNAQLLSWPSNGRPRRAGVNSLGVGGTNVHVLLEEAPALEPSGWGRTVQVIPISARTPSVLQEVSKNLNRYFEDYGETNLADAAFTLQVGRCHLEYRDFAVCGAEGALAACLKTKGSVARRVPKADHRPVFIFPPEPRAPRSSIAELCESEPLFREEIDHCTAALRQHLNLDVCGHWESLDDLVGARQSEIVAFVIEYSLAQLWIGWGVRPTATVGKGLGEVVAACVAGALSFEDALCRIYQPTSSEQSRSPVTITRTTIPCFLTSTGTWLTEKELVAAESWPWRDEPLAGCSTVSTLSSDQARIFLELGSGSEISRFLMQAREVGSSSPIVLTSLPPDDTGKCTMAHLLRSQGELWIAGIEIDWQRAHAGERRRRIPLPTYPFQRNRHWLDAAAPADA
jgi:acyl transferase domain-containing protein